MAISVRVPNGERCGRVLALSRKKRPCSKLEYKVTAVTGHIGQDEKHIRAMMNPDHPKYLKASRSAPRGSSPH